MQRLRVFGARGGGEGRRDGADGGSEWKRRGSRRHKEEQPQKWGRGEHGRGTGSHSKEGNWKGGAKRRVRCWPQGWLDRNWDKPRTFGTLDLENLGEMVPWRLE